jgi:hypothetical protein
VYGFNLECWLDVYFDTRITVDLFTELRNVMSEYFDLSAYRDRYTPKTGLKEKIDTIAILTMLLESGDKQALKEALVSVRDNYPLTGTYYLKEAEQMIEVLELRN